MRRWSASCTTRIIAAPIAAGTAGGMPVRPWVKKPTKIRAVMPRLQRSSVGSVILAVPASSAAGWPEASASR